MVFLFKKGEDPNTTAVNETASGQNSSPVDIFENPNTTVPQVKATLTKAKANVIAQALYNEMEGPNPFDDGSDIVDILTQCKNEADYVLVHSEFGEHYPSIPGSVLIGKFNLTWWLNSGEITSDKQWKRLHKMFPNFF
ncbi:hypothetical protein [Flavobacterium sp. HNIBRBA15423]|uniref:hypothetical protein n=1 Tax=Flavobacterium sp. HNIBRBA15423 TaxID=3458683 RepID=UPI00404503E5